MLSERSIAKESEPCAAELEQSSIEETHAQQSKIPTEPVYHTREVILVGERKWNDIPASRSCNGESLSAEISKIVMRLVRHYDQDEREIDGAVHWNFVGPKLRDAFKKDGGKISRTRIGFNTFVKEAAR